MKSKIIIIIAIIAVGFLVYAKMTLFESTSSGASKGKLEIKNLSVMGYIADTETINEKIPTSGTLLANKEVLLVPEVAGKITALHFKEGGIVSEGELLVKINDADLQAQLKKLRLQEKLAFETEQRHKKLTEAGGLSQEQYETSFTQYQTIKAEIEFVLSQIAKTEIKAPFTGKIGLVNVHEGSFINPSTAVATIQQISQLKIDFSIPEKYASSVKTGQNFIFTIEGDTNQYTAIVSAIEPKVDVSTRTLQVRAITDNTKGILFPGSYAKIEFPVNNSNSSIFIPTQSVIPVLKGQKVFISQNGKAKEIPIKTGLRLEKKIQVTEGLSIGDTVIVTGIMQLKPEMPMKVSILQ